MNKSIQSINYKIDEISKQIALLQSKKQNINIEKITELKTEMDDLLREKNAISQQYLNEIETAINDLDINYLLPIMAEQNINEAEAKTYIFNIIMSNSGQDLEAFYQTLQFYKENNITAQDIPDLKMYLSKFKKIQAQINQGILYAERKRQPQLLENATITAEIKKLEEKRRTYIDAANGIKKIIDGIKSDELSNLGTELKSAKMTMNELDKKGIDITVEILTLKKESALRKLIHKKKLEEKRNESAENSDKLDRQNEIIDKINKSIELNTKTLWNDLTESERQQIILHALSLKFASAEQVEEQIKQAIQSGNTSMFEYYQEYLKQRVYSLTHEIAGLKDKKNETQPIVDDINRMKTNPTCFTNLFHISLEDKVSYQVITDRYPFISNMSMEEIDMVINTNIDPITMCIVNSKTKKKTKNPKK